MFLLMFFNCPLAFALGNRSEFEVAYPQKENPATGDRIMMLPSFQVQDLELD